MGKIIAVVARPPPLWGGMGIFFFGFFFSFFFFFLFMISRLMEYVFGVADYFFF